MTVQNAAAILTKKLILEATETGIAYGSIELEMFRDAYPDRPLPQWTFGMYCGPVPTNSDRIREAYETVLDSAARQVWEAAA